MAKRIPPTERQIKYATEIAIALKIEFPICSAEFTQLAYSAFIQSHKDEYDNIVNWVDEEYLSFCGYYDNDAWCEYY